MRDRLAELKRLSNELSKQISCPIEWEFYPNNSEEIECLQTEVTILVAAIDNLERRIVQAKGEHHGLLWLSDFGNCGKLDILKNEIRSTSFELKECLEDFRQIAAEDIVSPAARRICETQWSLMNRRFFNLLHNYNQWQLAIEQDNDMDLADEWFEGYEGDIEMVELKDVEGYEEDYEREDEVDGQVTIAMQATDNGQEERLEQAQERQEALDKLEGDVIELNNAFVDMSVVVNSQIDHMDNIENYVRSNRDEVQLGALYASMAEEYKRSHKPGEMGCNFFTFIRTTKGCGLLICVAIFLTIVILVILRKNNDH